MSWSDPLKPQFLAVACAFPLAACFQPLYGGAEGRATVASLQAVHVDAIPDRAGHYLESALVSELNGTGAPITSRFRLVVTPAEDVQTPVISTITGQASSATLNVDAHYVLYTIPGAKVLTEGTAFTTAAYNRSVQEYANVTAAQDAEVRAAKSLADQIRLRLSGYFAVHGGA
jgi:LPS-assembly lipoprotein